MRTWPHPARSCAVEFPKVHILVRHKKADAKRPLYEVEKTRGVLVKIVLRCQAIGAGLVGITADAARLGHRGKR